MTIQIRNLEPPDSQVIADAFTEIGWNRPPAKFNRLLKLQRANLREVLVAHSDGVFAGYLNVVWKPEYRPFLEQGIPEVQDFNVLPKFRRQGIGSALMDEAERRIAKVSNTAGIGVGMYPDYGNAQRMYVLRGYVPDGRGLTYKREVLKPLATAPNDDDLAIYFTKQLQ